ncbi:hypothetical protein [Methylogaea oryzae]|uniref:Motility protein n=1 Tax=Methylogaea oryzae TaxID=1295382 RepID=A0A8D4VR41_9GAMM|nr:hypothetical protein [Methylogaea oryzae]BBL71769.1 hypothetical protein MoryE10_23750 [Methylogaea oryzae]
MNVSSVGGASMAAMLSSVNLDQQQGYAVANKVQEQMKLEGQQVLQLIDSASQSSAASGGGVGKTVDVMA